jgi:Undecaprenyl-phosphate galactose phosphotransferase WbaP
MSIKKWAVSLVLIIGDGAALYGVFRLAFWGRNSLDSIIGYGVPWEYVLPLFQLTFGFGVAVFLSQRLYPGYGLTAVKELERLAKSLTLVFFILAGGAYFNRAFLFFSRLILVFAWLMALGAVPLARFVLRNLLARTKWYGIPVIVYGDDDWAIEVADALGRITRLGWVVQQILPLSAIENDAIQKFPLAILAPSTHTTVDEHARTLRQQYRRVVLVHKRNNFGSFNVEPRDLDGQLGLEFQYLLLSSVSLAIKNLIDFLLGFLLFVFLLPLICLIAVVLYCDSPGPIFFRQERFGRDFHPFRVIKFRTMIVGAENKLAELLAQDSQAKEAYEIHHKLLADPRITRVGRWLRRYSLDELPQIFNVLRGEMSVVGPRAYMVTEIEDIQSYAPLILQVKPGITGWWQVMGRHRTTFQDRLQMDEHYISNWSLWMDVYILFKTVWVVLSGTGT